MNSRHLPLHLVRELRRGAKHGRAWASFIVRTKAGGQATVVFLGTVPRPNATGDHVAVKASYKRGDNGTWYVYSDAVIPRDTAQRSNEPLPPGRKCSMAVAAARTALTLALKALDERGAFVADAAHTYASHACDSLASYMAMHSLSDVPPQQFEDIDDDGGDLPYTDWLTADEAA